MAKGIQLTLMIGPAVPLPVSQEVLDSLTSLQVTTTSGQASGFQLTFALNSKSPLNTLFMLSGGSSIPLVRVVIAVTVNGVTDVLMDGDDNHHSRGRRRGRLRHRHGRRPEGGCII